jgi:predicted transcriptional regulator
MTNLEIIQQLNELSFQINTLMAAALGNDELNLNILNKNNNSNPNKITADNIGDVSEVDNFFLATELKDNSQISQVEGPEGEELEGLNSNIQITIPEGEEI